MKKTALVFGGLAGLFALLAGCSSGSSSSSSNSDGTGTASGSTSATLADRAFTVKDEPTAVTATTLTFTTTPAVQNYLVGDTLVPAVAGMTPYLRTIASIAVDSPAKGQTTFTTTQASLGDLFSDADLDQDLAVTSGDANSAADLGDGGAATTMSLNPLDYTYPLPSNTLNPLDFQPLPAGGKEFNLGQNGTYGKVNLSGNATLDMSESDFKISGGINFAYTKRGTINILPSHLRMVLTGGITVTVGGKLTTTGAITYESPEVKYGEEITLGTVVVTAGPVPIPILITLEFSGNEEIELAGKATFHESVTAAYQLSGGFDYTQAGGTTGVSSSKSLVNHAPFTINSDVKGSYKMFPLNAKVNFKAFDVAGPYLSLNPYVGMEIESEAIKGVYGIQGRMGGELEVFGHTLLDVNVTLFDASGTFASCATGTLVCGTGPIVEGAGE